MDGENKGKPYEQMDDLVGFPIIFGSTPKWFAGKRSERIREVVFSKSGDFFLQRF